jgi:2-iminoacetate synthase ThiH
MMTCAHAYILVATHPDEYRCRYCGHTQGEHQEAQVEVITPEEFEEDVKEAEPKKAAAHHDKRNIRGKRK